MTSPASGSATATTTAATPGSSSATRATDRMVDPTPPLDVADRDGREHRRRDRRSAKTFTLRLERPTPSPRRPALRDPAHRAGRLHRVALVLRCLGTGRVGRARVHRRAAGGRRGLDLPARRRRTGRRARGARADRRLVRLGGRHSGAARSAADRASFPLMAMLRLARRTGRSDLVRLVVSARSPDDLYYAAELPGPETTVIYTRTNPPGVDASAGPARAPPTSPTRSIPRRSRTCAARTGSPTPPPIC